MDDDGGLCRESATAADVADYASEMAAQLSAMCERAGLAGLAALFYAAHHEADRALGRPRREPRQSDAA
ncbi:MAG: hypothetical protein AB7M12_08490 [Hyphomonadaceae bacterium]